MCVFYYTFDCNILLMRKEFIKAGPTWIELTIASPNSVNQKLSSC